MAIFTTANRSRRQRIHQQDLAGIPVGMIPAIRAISIWRLTGTLSAAMV
jgi:hypothetical protein